MFRMNKMKRLFFPVLAVIVVTGTLAFAENDDSYIQLTRISTIEGNVGYQRVPDEEWDAVSANMPLEPGDRIYTGQGGRVEIEFEEGSVLRLSENTDIEILTLDEDYVQIRMLLGIASITVEKGLDFEIATPAAAFNTERDGIYRFEVTEDGRSDAIVRKGRLEAVSHQFKREIRDGDFIRAYPDAAGPTISDYNRRDAWDEWTDRRDADRRGPSTASRRYIPDNVSIGVSELDRHGRWVYVTNYGWGWVPYSVASSWSPYSVGRWVYRTRFGWTWVSYETWGWVPYHYGRWYRDTRYGWTWFPGERVTFRFWSPGLVVFYRGSGWVSWSPLAPGDYYDVSYYRYRRIYVADLARVRVLAVRQPGNYINRNARGAFQTVSVDYFRGVNTGTPNVNSRRNDIRQPWRQGTLVRGGLDVHPSRESYRPAPDRRGERPQVETNRSVVVRRTPSQSSGNDSRFSQAGNPRAPSTPDRANADRRNNNSAGNPAGRRPDENRPVSPNVAGENSSGNRDRQASPAQRNRSESVAPSGRPNSPDSSSRDSSGVNSDRPTVSKPSTLRENRQSERPERSSGSSSVRDNNRTSGGENSSGNQDRQTAPVQRERSSSPAKRDRSESVAPSGSQNSPDSSSRDSSGATSDRPAASRPSVPQENRQSERPERSNSSSPARDNNRTSGGENSSVNRDRQTSPAQRNRSESVAPSVRQNNQGSAMRDSSSRQQSSGAGRQNGASPSRNRK